MEQNLTAKVRIFIKNTFLYEIQNDSKRERARGDLKVLQLKKEKIYLLSIGNFNYSLSKDLSVMRSTRDQYVFPMFNGFLGVIIPEDTDYELLETFEAILEETTDFTISNHRRASQQINKSHTLDLEAVKTAQTTTKTKKLSMLLEQGGEHIKNGLVRAATYTSKGIKKGSEYLKTKIKKKDKPLKVSEDQSSAIKHLKTATNLALMVSKALVVGAMATTKEIGQ